MNRLLSTVFGAMLLCQPAGLASSPAQGAASSIPDPLRFYNKYEIVWDVVRGSLMKLGFDIESEDRSGGKIRTRFLEFSSGSLAAGDLAKFCTAPRLTDGTWIKARYSVEASLERIGATEVLFTVDSNVEGLKRDFQGHETWMGSPSNGTLERRVYSEVGKKLLGGDFTPAQKKGFWDQGPQPVPSPKIQPTLPAPDRKPPR